MADVDIIPKIRCDNCGLTVEKEQRGTGPSRSFHRPGKWGSLKIEGGRSIDSYGMKGRLDFTDLCPSCANAAIDAAAAALKSARREDAE
ncbi:hypothetical protein [Sinorhizobium meliloti]|uniref:hypothetical protein n=1 Tax=Rhizobium meliloti TaxID=382 RepID=UPI000B4A1581|nr:hypothetical protein [Sinorhizobium meliloti]ASP64417.1 hypothetical protein CDO29_07335 [Sinorhizobium meliloti]ASP85038.1 hypothetical protein CDO26_10810 [Sinorhizobium meliloti]MQW28460.1 hypothetical protein [Sinorhizobium meliloti]MQX00840.1 hypothetical protein [Sinorhizobium meliloti]RVK42044.1 hypothetical protein CN160_31895 [Sinorhizobium meliloti]